MIDRIVLNIPHSSSEFPGMAKASWGTGIDEHIQRWTDWGTNHLFGMAAFKDPRIHPVAFPWSRFFCDVERLENENIYRSYYLEHMAAIMKELTPSSMLIDCHSFPADLSDVEVCIGVNKDWSQPDKDLLSRIERIFQSRGYKTAFNKPYSNSFAPRMNFRYPSLMIELNKSIYMNADGEIDREKSEKITAAIEKMYDMIFEPWVHVVFHQNAYFLYEKRFEIWSNPRMASALTGTVYYNGKRVTIGGYLKAVEMYPDLFFTRNSLIVDFGGSPLSGATVNTAVKLGNGLIWSFKGSSFGSKTKAYVEGHSFYPVREGALPLSIVVEILKNSDH